MTSLDRDAGLQPQRTALAWNRTALAVSVNALLVLRLGEQSAQLPTTALGIFLLAAAAGVVGAGMWRRRMLAATPPVGPPARMLAAMVGVVWLACAAGVASIIATAASG